MKFYNDVRYVKQHAERHDLIYYAKVQKYKNHYWVYYKKQ